MGGRVAQKAAWKSDELLYEGLLGVQRVCQHVSDAIVHSLQASGVGVPNPGHLHGVSYEYTQAMSCMNLYADSGAA